MYSTISNIHNTIDCVLEKGSEILYDKYLTNKLPAHQTENTNKYLYETSHLMEQQPGPRQRVPIEKVPRITKI